MRIVISRHVEDDHSPRLDGSGGRGRHASVANLATTVVLSPVICRVSQTETPWRERCRPSRSAETTLSCVSQKLLSTLVMASAMRQVVGDRTTVFAVQRFGACWHGWVVGVRLCWSTVGSRNSS
jgi:hypothetical protein